MAAEQDLVMDTTPPREVVMEGVSKLKVTASEGSVRVSYEVTRTEYIDLGALIGLAVAGQAHVTISSTERQIPLPVDPETGISRRAPGRAWARSASATGPPTPSARS